MASPNWLDAAASFATCQTLTSAGSALVGAGAVSMVGGGAGVVPLSLGMLSLLAAGAACQPTPVDGVEDPVQVDGCYKMSAGGWAQLQIKRRSTDPWEDLTDSRFANNDEVTEILGVTVVNVGGLIPWEIQVSYNTLSGQRSGYTERHTKEEAEGLLFRLRALSGSCGTETGQPQPYPPNFHDPVQYTDPTTSCVYNISPQGFVEESTGGGAGFVMKIEAAGPQARAGGGVVGGCNFEPTLVYQPPGGGPPTTIPWDPDWPDWDGSGIPPWLAPLIGAAGGVAGTIVSDLMDQFFATKYPPGSRTIRAACEYKEDGTPETFTVNYPEEPYQARVLTALDAITDFQQQILLWKTPTCSGSGSSVTGDAVSINWVSDEYSPNGNDRIRKLFTYFDQVGSTLEQTVTHWKDFTWNAGPVIVSCVGTPLGRPQVWADSVDEAKRVIQHAATIAGVDLTKAEWQVAPPKSSRYGMTGLMRVHRSNNGTLGITKRDGPSGSPMGLV